MTKLIMYGDGLTITGGLQHHISALNDVARQITDCKERLMQKGLLAESSKVEIKVRTYFSPNSLHPQLCWQLIHHQTESNQKETT